MEKNKQKTYQNNSKWPKSTEEVNVTVNIMNLSLTGYPDRKTKGIEMKKMVQVYFNFTGNDPQQFDHLNFNFSYHCNQTSNYHESSVCL